MTFNIQPAKKRLITPFYSRPENQYGPKSERELRYEAVKIFRRMGKLNHWPKEKIRRILKNWRKQWVYKDAQGPLILTD